MDEREGALGSNSFSFLGRLLLLAPNLESEGKHLKGRCLGGTPVILKCGSRLVARALGSSELSG